MRLSKRLHLLRARLPRRSKAIATAKIKVARITTVRCVCRSPLLVQVVKRESDHRRPLVRWIAIGAFTCPAWDDDRRFGSRTKNAEQFVEKVDALIACQMFDKMAGMRLVNAAVLPRPFLAQVHDGIDLAITRFYLPFWTPHCSYAIHHGTARVRTMRILR